MILPFAKNVASWAHGLAGSKATRGSFGTLALGGTRSGRKCLSATGGGNCDGYQSLVARRGHNVAWPQLMAQDRQQDIRTDDLADDVDSRWLTIAELAESRGISKASASRLVRRRRWRRMPDNRGAIRVYVPIGEELPQDRCPDDRPDIPADDIPDVRTIVSVKDEVIAGHLAHIDTLKAALTKAEVRAEDLQRELDRWRMAGWWRRRRLRRAWWRAQKG